MTIEEACNKYGLHVWQVEYNVFKVVNMKKEINVDKFIRDLNNCIIITNFSRNYDRDRTNTCWNVSNIYS